MKSRNKRGRLPSGEPNPIDVHVGKRVFQRRVLLGMSQEQLGEALGLSFQQVQKYERGANRVGSSRLFDLATILKVPVSFFFDDMSEDVQNLTPSNLGRGVSEPVEIPSNVDATIKRDALQLVHAYYRITDPRLRKQIFELAKTLAAAADGEE